MIYVNMCITYAFVLLLSLCVCENIISNSAPLICKLADTKCTAENRQVFYQNVLESNSEIGTEDLDPMYHEVIDGKLSIVTYKLTNTTLEGFKKCIAGVFEFNSTIFGVHIKLLCPELKMHGIYDMHGKLTQDLPIEGNGNFDLQTRKPLFCDEIITKNYVDPLKFQDNKYNVQKEYSVNVDMVLEIVQGSDGKNYVTVKTYSVLAEALSPIVFNFENLFNGQKDLAENVHKFANENWKEVSDNLQGPAFVAHMKKMVNNLNKILKRIPAEKNI